MSLSATCKLENQESWWYNSVWAQRPENQELQCLRAEEGGCTNSRREKKFSMLWLFDLLEPSKDDAHPHWWGQVFFPQSLDSNANLSGNILTDTPRTKVLPALWASLSPAKLTHKLNHHCLHEWRPRGYYLALFPHEVRLWVSARGPVSHTSYFPTAEMLCIGEQRFKVPLEREKRLG